jgi:hypothetical protein
MASSAFSPAGLARAEPAGRARSASGAGSGRAAACADHASRRKPCARAIAGPLGSGRQVHDPGPYSIDQEQSLAQAHQLMATVDGMRAFVDMLETRLSH